MDTVRIIKPNAGVVDRIIRNVREADCAELWAASYSTPEEIIRDGLKNSGDVFVGLVNRKPVCIWGVVPGDMVMNSGIIWMVTTCHLDAGSVSFLRKCRSQLMELLKKYDILVNYVDARNEVVIKWLKWLGFSLDDPKPYGLQQQAFRRFMIKG